MRVKKKNLRNDKEEVRNGEAERYVHTYMHDNSKWLRRQRFASSLALTCFSIPSFRNEGVQTQILLIMLAILTRCDSVSSKEKQTNQQQKTKENEIIIILILSFIFIVAAIKNAIQDMT